MQGDKFILPGVRKAGRSVDASIVDGAPQNPTISWRGRPRPKRRTAPPKFRDLPDRGGADPVHSETESAEFEDFQDASY